MLRKIKNEVDKLIHIAEIFDSAGEYEVSERITARLLSYSNKRYAQFEDDEIQDDVPQEALPEPEIVSPQLITPENKFDNAELGHIKINDWYHFSPYDLANLFIMSLSKGNDVGSSFRYFKQDLPSNLESFFQGPVDLDDLHQVNSKMINEAMSLSFGKFFSPVFYRSGTTLIHLLYTDTEIVILSINDVIESSKTHTTEYNNTKNEIISAIREKDPSVDYNVIYKYLYYKIYNTHNAADLLIFQNNSTELINAINLKDLQTAINLYLEYDNVKVFESNSLQDIDRILDSLSLYDVSVIKQAYEIYRLPTEFYNYNPTIKEIARGYRLDNELRYKNIVDEFSRKNPLIIRFPKKIQVDELVKIIYNFDNLEDIKQLISTYNGNLSMYQIRQRNLDTLINRGEVPEALLQAEQNDPNFIELSANAVHLYKVNPQKLITIFSSENRDLIRHINYDNIFPCNPEKFMDYVISKIDEIHFFESIITTSILKTFPILYSHFGDKIYDLSDRVIRHISSACILTTGEVQIDDLDSLIKITDRPDVDTENMSDAVNFYFKFPDLEHLNFQKVKNLTILYGTNYDTMGVMLREYGSITPDALLLINGIKGFNNKRLEHLKFLIDNNKKSNFAIGSIRVVLNKLIDHENLDSFNIPLEELLLILDDPYTGLEFEEGKFRIQQVKKSIQKLAERNPQYAQLKEGTREYNLVVRMIYYNLSLAGKSPDIILDLVDKCLSGLYLQQFSYDNNQLQCFKHSLKYLNLPLTTENLNKIRMYYNNIYNALGVKGFVNERRRSYTDFFYYIIQNYGIVEDYEAVINDIFNKNISPFTELPEENIEANIEINPDSLNKIFNDKIVQELYNLSNCIALFGKLTEKFLNKFYLPKFNNLKGTKFIHFNQITNEYNYEFEKILKDLVPSITYKTQGFAQYYLNQATPNNMKQIFNIAKFWSSRIDIYNEKFEIVMPEKEVSEIAYQFTPEDLSNEIRISDSFRLDYDRLKEEGVDKRFTVLYLNAADNDNRSASNTNDLIILNNIYEAGKSVEKADWMKYDKTINQGKYSLRGYFLSNNDPRGMWLGDLSRCCQHPYGAGRTCSIDGVLNPNAGFFVLELNKQLCMMSYVWADKLGNICFDSLETIGDKSYHSDTVKQMIKKIIEDFGSNQQNKLVVVGDTAVVNFLGSINYQLVNSSNSHLNNFGWKECDREIYTDANKQSVISDNRDEETKNRFIKYHSVYFVNGLDCPVCETRKKSDKCVYCGWTPSDYEQCVYCGNNTWNKLEEKCVADGCEQIRNIENSTDQFIPEFGDDDY